MGGEPAEYSPDQIRFWLAGRCPNCRWSMLESAVEGGTGCSGMGSGRGERFGLSHLKADLEHAADQLPLHWQSTAFIFARQHRASTLTQRRQVASMTNQVSDAIRTGSLVDGSPVQPTEHPIPSQALEDAIYRMSKSLGWEPSLTNAA